MSPADREEDLMLFIREHLPQTAFSHLHEAWCSCLGTVRPGRGHGQKGRSTLCPLSPPASQHTGLTVPLSSLSAGLCTPLLPQSCLVALTAPVPELSVVSPYSVSTPLPFRPDPQALSQRAVELSGCRQAKVIMAQLMGGFTLNSCITGGTWGGVQQGALARVFFNARAGETELGFPGGVRTSPTKGFS